MKFVRYMQPFFLMIYFYNSTLDPRLEYAFKKKVFWCIEQPSSSLLPFYKPLEAEAIKIFWKSNV